MLTSIKSRIKAISKSSNADADACTDASIARKAKKAEKAIAASAEDDLVEWETRNGFRSRGFHAGTEVSTPRSSIANSHLQGTPSSRSGKSQLDGLQLVGHIEASAVPAAVKILYNGGSTATSSTAELTDLTVVGQADTSKSLRRDSTGLYEQGPDVRLSHVLHWETAPLVKPPTGADLCETTSASVNIPPSSGETHQENQKADPRLTESSEKQELLQEIQRIQETIKALRESMPATSTSSDRISIPRSLSAQAVPPWLSRDQASRLQFYKDRRGAPRSDARLQRRQSTSIADLFAEEPLPPLIPMNSIVHPPRPDRTFSAEARIFETGPLSINHSAATLTEYQHQIRPALTPPRPERAVQHHARPAERLSRTQSTPAQPRKPAIGTARQVIVDPEAARRQYLAALGRSRTRSSPSRPAGAQRGFLTMHELQERHASKLREIQQPLTEKLTHEYTIKTAKDAWRLRIERERREQQKRAHGTVQVADGPTENWQQPIQPIQPRLSRRITEQNRCSRPVTMVIHEVENEDEEDDENTPLAHLVDRRQQGAQRAAEWRQSMSNLAQVVPTRPHAPTTNTSGQRDAEAYARSRHHSMTPGHSRPLATPLQNRTMFRPAHCQFYGSTVSPSAMSLGPCPAREQQRADLRRSQSQQVQGRQSLAQQQWPQQQNQQRHSFHVTNF